MKPLVKHIILPALTPVALVILYFTPITVFGCANRGLLAMGVVLLAAIAALGTTIKSVVVRRRSTSEANWWLVSTLVLLSTIFLLFGPLR